MVRASENLADQVAFDAIAVKTIVLSAASFFEREICQAILGAALTCKMPVPLRVFIEKQGLERKYHSLFDWKANNLNKFFSLFGDETKDSLSGRSKEDPLPLAIRDFLYLSRARNELVHENFAGASIELTFEEAWQKYEGAMPFIAWFSQELHSFCSSRTET